MVANGVGCISELVRNTATKKKGQKKKGKKVGSPIWTPTKKYKLLIVLAYAADTDLRRVVWGAPQARMSSALCILCTVGCCYSARQQKSTKNINDVFLFKTQNKHYFTFCKI